MTEIVFESLYQRAIEHLTLTESDGRIHAESVIGAQQFGLRYSIDCDARWNFQRAEIVCGRRRIQIERNGAEWRVNGELRDDLRGSTEMDIAATPFTNTLPIRRLQIPIGDERAIAAITVDADGLVSDYSPWFRRISCGI
jgi:uncharacterized protein